MEEYENLKEMVRVEIEKDKFRMIGDNGIFISAV